VKSEDTFLDTRVQQSTQLITDHGKPGMWHLQKIGASIVYLWLLLDISLITLYTAVIVDVDLQVEETW